MRELHACFGAECSSGPAVELTADHVLHSGPCSIAAGVRAAEPRGHLGLSKDKIDTFSFVFIGNAQAEHMFKKGGVA